MATNHESIVWYLHKLDKETTTYTFFQDEVKETLVYRTYASALEEKQAKNKRSKKFTYVGPYRAKWGSA